VAEYVTTEEVRNHLMVDTTAHDAWINMMIPAISGAVESWLKDSWRAYVLAVDSNGEVIRDSNGDGLPIEDSNGPVVHPTVKAATLVEMAVQFRFRDGDGTPGVPSHWGHGYVLSAGPTSLLTAFRKTTVS
jgi:hypothetical protein